MRASHFCLAIASAPLFLASPAAAFPDDAAELSEIIGSEYGGNANLYVADEAGDFRRMGCRGRNDLMQELLDSGLAMDQVDPDHRIDMFVCAVYDERAEFLQAFLTPEWLAEIDAEYLGRRPISPLMFAMSENDYALTMALLANKPRYYHWQGKRVENLTPEGHLLLGAYRARKSKKDRSLAAYVEALPADLIEDSRNDAFVDMVDDFALGRGGTNNGGGGGGGFLGGIADIALGAALGGSPTDFLIASAGASLLDAGGDGSEGSDAAPANNADMQRKLARYLTVVNAPTEPEPAPTPATQPAAPQATVSQSLSTLDQLERLADLRDRGVLTEEQFEALKTQILGSADN